MSTASLYILYRTRTDLQLIIDKIWSLSKLTYCHFDVRIEGQPTFCLPTIISSSLKYLYLPKNRAHHLRTLKFEQDVSLPLHLSLFNYTNTSVRELILVGCDYCFNEEECILFSRSPLGVQCEVLLIEVNNRETIIHLVKHMIKLRALHVRYDDGMN
ncbi:unnamed protein product [Rotaria sordida]|uniref:Uncharacterized protein n=1 Tax=Rotaria sordida TaxID=392033 RepID=A0A818W843_9BILA|nr:unnamed protein product [Rotaria sordida]